MHSSAIVITKRKYEPAWLLLKQRRVVTLRVAPHLVARVKKAVIKEKDMDITYKVESEAVGRKRQRLVIKYDAKDWNLVFRMVDCETIYVGDL